MINYINQKYNQKLASIRFKSMIFLSVTMISIMSILNSQYLNSNIFLISYNGVVVATLPFEPISLLRGMSHRTLRGEDYTQCSMTFLYLLASAGIRGNVFFLLLLFWFRYKNYLVMILLHHLYTNKQMNLVQNYNNSFFFYFFSLKSGR